MKWIHALVVFALLFVCASLVVAVNTDGDSLFNVLDVSSFDSAEYSSSRCTQFQDLDGVSQLQSRCFQ